MTTDTIIDRCEAKGLRMTEQRRIIARVLEASDDHPDVEELYARASKIDPDHLINLQTGEVIEFVDPEIEDLQEKIAAKLGFDLRGHKLELYGVPKKSS